MLDVIPGADAGKTPDRQTRRMPTRADRIALVLLFVVYLVVLTWLVLFKLHEPFIGRDDMREIKLIPFLPSETYGASSPFEVILNLLVFIPFGIYLRSLTPWRPAAVVAVVAGVSVAYEVTQFALALGSSDLTDVLVNTAGGLAGVLLFRLILRRSGSRTPTVVTRAAAILTVAALIGVGLHIQSFPRMPGGGVVVIE